MKDILNTGIIKRESFISHGNDENRISRRQAERESPCVSCSNLLLCSNEKIVCSEFYNYTQGSDFYHMKNPNRVASKAIYRKMYTDHKPKLRAV